MFDSDSGSAVDQPSSFSKQFKQKVADKTDPSKKIQNDHISKQGSIQGYQGSFQGNVASKDDDDLIYSTVFSEQSSTQLQHLYKQRHISNRIHQQKYSHNGPQNKPQNQLSNQPQNNVHYESSQNQEQSISTLAFSDIGRALQFGDSQRLKTDFQDRVHYKVREQDCIQSNMPSNIRARDHQTQYKSQQQSDMSNQTDDGCQDWVSGLIMEASLLKKHIFKLQNAQEQAAQKHTWQLNEYQLNVRSARSRVNTLQSALKQANSSLVKQKQHVEHCQNQIRKREQRELALINRIQELQSELISVQEFSASQSQVREVIDAHSNLITNAIGTNSSPRTRSMHNRQHSELELNSDSSMVQGHPAPCEMTRLEQQMLELEQLRIQEQSQFNQEREALLNENAKLAQSIESLQQYIQQNLEQKRVAMQLQSNSQSTDCQNQLAQANDGQVQSHQKNSLCLKAATRISEDCRSQTCADTKKQFYRQQYEKDLVITSLRKDIDCLLDFFSATVSASDTNGMAVSYPTRQGK